MALTGVWDGAQHVFLGDVSSRVTIWPHDCAHDSCFDPTSWHFFTGTSVRSPASSTIGARRTPRARIITALTDVIGLVPAVGPILKGIATFAGTKIPFSSAHDALLIPIQRNATGDVVAINRTPVGEVAFV